MNRGFISIGFVIALVAVILIGAGGYWYATQPSTSVPADVSTLQDYTNDKTKSGAENRTKLAMQQASTKTSISGTYQVNPMGFYPTRTIRFTPDVPISGKEAFLIADTENVLKLFGISKLQNGCTYRGRIAFDYHVVSWGIDDSDALPTIALDKLTVFDGAQHDLHCDSAVSYTNDLYGYRITHPSNWVYENFSQSAVGFGTPESKQGGYYWTIRNHFGVDMDTLIADFGKQFSDRTESRQTMTVAGLPAHLITIESKASAWVLHVVYIEYKGLMEINDGAAKVSGFADFYQSFTPTSTSKPIGL